MLTSFFLSPLERLFSAGPRWKTTFQFSTMLDLVLLDDCEEQTEIYRWRWQAERAARRHRQAQVDGVVTDAFVEIYWPGSNVVPLRRPRRLATCC